MNIKSFIYHKRINIAKFLLIGCIFLSAILFFSRQINALNVNVVSSTYTGNSLNNAAVTIDGVKDRYNNDLKFIQGNGQSNHDGITFEMTDVYTNLTDFTAFAVWEQDFSESAGAYADYDRWYLRTADCTGIAADATCPQVEALSSNTYVVRDGSNNIITSGRVTVGSEIKVYYLEMSSENITTSATDANFVDTVVDFTRFFSDKKITYTYRIRNNNYIIHNDGFGYKEVIINFWQAGDGKNTPPNATYTIEFGLARVISDVGTHTNIADTTLRNSLDAIVSIDCSMHMDKICVDYSDTNGLPTASTVTPATINVFVPANTLFAMEDPVTSTAMVLEAKENGTDYLDYASANTKLYLLNYFCESDTITQPTITNASSGSHTATCATGTDKREYLYVNGYVKNYDVNSLDSDTGEHIVHFGNLARAFVPQRYDIRFDARVDAKGSYVVVITDYFGNTNELAVFKVEDVMNQAILANFNKSNKAAGVVADIDGWKANEYLTNEDVRVNMTMTATTVIKQGLAILPATSTSLYASHVEEIGYWRVPGANYDSDICLEDTDLATCAILAKGVAGAGYLELYTASTGGNTANGFVSFVDNVVTLDIHTNGRYRFYIKTYSNSNTNDNQGENKNPRLEIYKIDKEAPVILFGGSDDSNCIGGTCEYDENTYEYYQGSGHASGTVVNKLTNAMSTSPYKIVYSPNSIYYVSANGESSVIHSSVDNNINPDSFYTYLYALFDSEAYIKENLRGHNDTLTEYAHYYFTNRTTGVYSQDYTGLIERYLVMDAEGFESSYRKYVIANDYKYTSFALAISDMNDDTNMRLAHTYGSGAGALTFSLASGLNLYNQDRIEIEYFDGVHSDTTVCSALEASSLGVDFDGNESIDQVECVNYYLDHGMSFYVKVTVRDVIQFLTGEHAGEYKFGNETSRTIFVEVHDTTAPGFNEEIKHYNVGSECRIEIGNTIGIGNQNMDALLGCYGITTNSGSLSYQYEDNVFASLYSRVQTINTRSHVRLYILNKRTGMWVRLDQNENSSGYTPNRSGDYALLAIISDDASTTTSFNVADMAGLSTLHGVSVSATANTITVDGNALGVLLSYYVDKKIVLVTPEANEKFYGEEDPIFGYCVSVNKNNGNIATYLDAPFADMTVFTPVGNSTGCTTRDASTGAVSLSTSELQDLFKDNYAQDNATFTGALTRQESLRYNSELYQNGPTYYDANNYVGIYRIVLGTLDIVGDNDLGEDYIIKIDPRVRNGVNPTDRNGLVKGGVEMSGMYQLHFQLERGNKDTNSHNYNGANKCNLVDSQIYFNGTSNVSATGCYGFSDDDDFFVESNIIFTIKQVVLTITATGSSKVYGTIDPNGTRTSYNIVNDSDGKMYLSSLDASNNVVNSYSVSGLQNNGTTYTDTIDVVMGVLRREVGENVGIYSICNFRGTEYNQNSLETKNDMLAVGANDTEYYQNCHYLENKKFSADESLTAEQVSALNSLTINPATANYVNGIMVLSGDSVVNDTYIKSRSLYIQTNSNRTTGFAKSINVTDDYRNNNYANYVINYVEATFEIKPAKLIVQPTPGQRREYSYDGVDEVNPWEVVIYNQQFFEVLNPTIGFNGFTQNDPSKDSSFVAAANDPKSVDTPSPILNEEHYNNATEDRVTWKLVDNGVTYTGIKSNETYPLFTGRIGLNGYSASSGLFLSMPAGWYTYSELLDNESSLKISVNGRVQCNYVNATRTTIVNTSAAAPCRNYNLVLDLDYRNENGYKNGDYDEANDTTVEVIYKSKDKLCTIGDPGNTCSLANSSKILFEVYRREIIMEFNSLLETMPTNGDDIVYGKRYDYYKTNLFTIDNANKNVFKANTTVSLENNLFYCYSSYEDGLVGFSGGCTDNEWYGLTKGDTWGNLGIEFHLHSIVSSASGDYYDTATDYAIPAGRYYVYATINNPNYKFTYMGGTLTIKTKVVGITMTSYSKEYGDVYLKYNNSYKTKIVSGESVYCFKDGSLLHGTGLISDCDIYTNDATNTYGFVIDGLDTKDTISANFNGRPLRDSHVLSGDLNGLQENVGVYPIRVGSVVSISNGLFSNNNGNNDACLDSFVGDESKCVVVGNVDIHNYIIGNDNISSYALTYHLLKNGTEANNKDYTSSAITSVVNSVALSTNVIDGTLKITPADIEITVAANQTKMYGCAYSASNVSSVYRYTYNDSYGYYDCVIANVANADFGYEYTVSGDKDYYIYNYGYYDDTNYTYDSVTYTHSKINDVTRSTVANNLLIAAATNTGARSSALNGGVLYRINVSKYSGSISYSDLVSAANSGQASGDERTYQGQSVGTYIITLGNLDATLTSNLAGYSEANNKTCNASNEPGEGNNICKNYIIHYYNNTSISSTHTYDISTKAELKFVVTPRVAFVYTNYNSKVYGSDEPDMACDIATVSGTSRVNLGNSCYYTKTTSLAKAPWVASIDSEVVSGTLVEKTGIAFSVTHDDYQLDVVTGKLSRIGMEGKAKDKDDIVGSYNFLYDAVTTTTYSSNNYNLNFYLREMSTDTITNPSLAIKYINIVNGVIDETTNGYILDENKTYYSNGEYQFLAVTDDGQNEQIVRELTKKIVFEINLRRITVTLISFTKVYGIEDNSAFFDLAVCATGEEEVVYDEDGNPMCSHIDGQAYEHGLSDSHKSEYVDANGLLKQAEFKRDFGVFYDRALGENVVCANRDATTGYCLDNGSSSGGVTRVETDENSNPVEVSLSYSLNFTNDGYEVYGFIDQGAGQRGRNYEITYVKGTMKIIPRTITITPDSNQGFQYGSYTYPSLIPAITYEDTLRNYNYRNANEKIVTYLVDEGETKIVIVGRSKNDGVADTTVITDTGLTTTGYGLVHGDMDAQSCLVNIKSDALHQYVFCINDRQDTYNRGEDETSTSSYTFNASGLSSGQATYIFGDSYSDEGSTRKALNRTISGSPNQRYNRNVGVYTIVQDTLTDNTGNYSLVFTDGVTYEITPSDLLITPDNGQSKIYGEADKELTFTITTTYTVNNDQWITDDSSIVSVGGIPKASLTINPTKGIKATSGDVVVLNGFAYYENIDSVNYNYGRIKNYNKSANNPTIAQANSVIGKPYDKYCYDNYNNNSTVLTGTIANSDCSDMTNQKVYISSTDLILIGYLYVNNYAQRAGTYDIVNGFVVSNNEYGNKNYDLHIQEHVQFVINTLNIKLKIENITKDYGETTDRYKCEGIAFADCEIRLDLLNAQDNEAMLEYNFDIYYKDSTTPIAPTGNDVLMVNAINGNYYTQSEDKENKNIHLGVTVTRLRDHVNDSCSVLSDEFGCEDANEYVLVLRKQAVTSDIDENYNLMVDDSTDITTTTFNTREDIDKYVLVNAIETNHPVENATTGELVIISNLDATLTINKRAVDIFVNTNLNVSEDNYYEIEQNIKAPTLPTIDNTYNLVGYNYNSTKTYHGIGINASSSSTSLNLASTYTKIVWGDKPHQVRVTDALIGAVAYCNQPVNGSYYRNDYPKVNEVCASDNLGTHPGTLVYNADRSTVNTNTSGKFIAITRDPTSELGLKIAHSSTTTNYDNNDYETKNYTVSFYPGALHIVEDTDAPNLVIGNKDYYIEANARSEGSANSNSVGTILEYLFNGADTGYVLLSVDSDGALYFMDGANKVIVDKSSLWSTYGNRNPDYPGIVSEVELNSIYPFISDFAHTHTLDGMGDPYPTYENETNITSLAELITTLVKWFEVSSYDDGQIINGVRLDRKFDRYYYIGINKYGYDIGNDIDNEFAINKVGTYNVYFYVMDNAGRISKDNNIARLHIIDTTAPTLGEITLYNTDVKCDTNCNEAENFYINQGTVKLASFNRYKFIDNINGDYKVDEVKGYFVLDEAGEYIYFGEIGDTNPYKKISTLPINETDYEKTLTLDIVTKKYSAKGVIHYSWDSNSSGISLSITGGSDNSYTDVTNYKNSQWSYYYSIDGGVYYIQYELTDNMVAPKATISDGTRVIKMVTMDKGVSITSSGTSNSVSFDACYDDGCKSIKVPYKVSINSEVKTFYDSQVDYKSFTNGTITCVLNEIETLFTCSDSVNGEIASYNVLRGNRFTYGGTNYIISGNNILDAGESRSYYTKFNKYSVVLDGVRYVFDRAAMKLYRYYYATFNNLDGLTQEEKDALPLGKAISIEGVTYYIRTDINKVVRCTESCTSFAPGEIDFDGDNYSFVLDGSTYRYFENAADRDGYYVGVKSYDVYSDTFILGDAENETTYNISDFDVISKTMNVNDNILRLTSSVTYTNTYSLYDEWLLGLTNRYTETGSSSLDLEVVSFRTYINSHTAWNLATPDAGSVDSELSEYLGETIVSRRDEKIAYLDRVKPEIGTRMGGISYGEDWYVYEYGYYNEIKLDTATHSYSIRGKVYTFNFDTGVVECDGVSYQVYQDNGADESHRYYYTINYVKYYLNADRDTVIWFNNYVEKYVGVKDYFNPTNINSTEIPYYSIDTSIYANLGTDNQISKHTRSEFDLITSNTTASSSGIGSTKYSSKGRGVESSEKGITGLYDFVYMGRYSEGIYYEDLDYIVWYVHPTTGAIIKTDLSNEFATCRVDDVITPDCAQSNIDSLINSVIATINTADNEYDITYTINYVVRDKAGNASKFAARGVLYATIQPHTNIIVNNIPASEINMGVSLTNIGENEYQLVANQGVSLEILSEAFKVDYGSTYHNYNNNALMDIYKDNELIVSGARGVNFTSYINGDEIADYKVVYTMNSVYTTYLGQEIPLSGKTVTLNISIRGPMVLEDNLVTPESVVKNSSSLPLIAIVVSMLGMMIVGGIVLFRRKRS